MRLRHRGNTAAFRETAGPGEVGLDDVDRTAGDQLTKAVEPDLGLVAGDRRGERIGDHGTARDVVDRFALLVEAAAGVSFDPVAAAAEKTVERQFGDLAGDVPERDVDAADCIHNDAAPPELSGAREHLLPQPLDQQRVLADQHRPQHLLDNARGGPTADPGLTDPGHPLVGLDLDQQAAAPRLHAAGAAIGRLAAIGERYRADIDDLHDFSPRSAPPAMLTRPAS